MKENLSKKPFHLNKETWVYEDHDGIDVMHEIKVNGQFVRTDRFKVPIKKIRDYIRRLDKGR